MDNRIQTCRNIVKNHQCEWIQNTQIDVQVANAILTLHDALGTENRVKYCNYHIAVMAEIAWKVLAKASQPSTQPPAASHGISKTA